MDCGHSPQIVKVALKIANNWWCSKGAYTCVSSKPRADWAVGLFTSPWLIYSYPSQMGSFRPDLIKTCLKEACYRGSGSSRLVWSCLQNISGLTTMQLVILQGPPVLENWPIIALHLAMLIAMLSSMPRCNANMLKVSNRHCHLIYP